MEASNTSGHLYSLIQRANQSFNAPNWDEDVFNKAVVNAFENRELFLHNKSLLSAWKALSIKSAKYLNVPTSSRALRCIKQINAYTSQQSFFPSIDGDFCEDAFKSIALKLDLHNPYLSPFSTQLIPLALVSKKWNHAINEIQISFAKEHRRLKKQEKLFLKANCKTIGKAVNFIIKHQLEVARLSGFEDLNSDLLEKLISNCASLKHLSISSHLIITLPQSCSQLETLYCSCLELKQLPTDLKQLKSLTCISCHELKSLPKSLPKLTKLICFDCSQLLNLPDMPQLKSLDCSYNYQLLSLPELPQLTSLNCSVCWQLKTLPPLPQLISLNSEYCPYITRLPACSTKLTRLTCSGLSCTHLEEFIGPKLQRQLTLIDCSYCPKLASLPALPQLKSLICKGLSFTNLSEFIKAKSHPQLTYLDCSDNPKLISLAHLPQLKRFRRFGCPNLIIQDGDLPKSCCIKDDFFLTPHSEQEYHFLEIFQDR